VNETLDLTAFLTEVKEICNERLEILLRPPEERADYIHEAMNYSVFAGGKRFRPALVIAAGRMFNAPPVALLDLACGIEMIHTYSLIHDDLPCMDDDDLRRGKPTLHRAFDEGIAVLAGDALYALAFEVIAHAAPAHIVASIARATGTPGMIGGQVADIRLEGQDITHEDLTYIHTRKTGALITVSLKAGAALGDVRPEELDRVQAFGEKVGLAFQIVDDVLDETGDTRVLGKTAGADREREKNTWPRVHGLDEARKTALGLIEEAKNGLVLPEREAIIFTLLADFVVQRVM